MPVFAISEVALIPLSSQAEAKKAIDQANELLQRDSGQDSLNVGDSDTSDDEEIHAGVRSEEEAGVSPTSSSSANETRPLDSGRSNSNVAEDVIGKKGQYGRFAERWFSKKGWSTEKRRAQGMSTDEAGISRSAGTQEDLVKSQARPEHPGSSPGKEETITQDPGVREVKQADIVPEFGHVVSAPNVTGTLLPKLLRTTRMLLESGSFFFCYDLDITRRIGTQGSTSSQLPLYKLVDPMFFWNYHLMRPLINGGHSAYVLPLMQGFVGQRAFTVDPEAVDPSNAITSTEEDVSSVIETQKQVEADKEGSHYLITLISRRSLKRPGLRYLRRGVDDDGHCANTVETEQILSKASWVSSERIHSFTQIRASIPLFFSQSPYSFKPVPVLQHSQETNQRALNRHFSNLMERYGDVQVALLVDKKGGEAEIGQRFEESTANLNSTGSLKKKVGFEWFDFHTICRGMKFENVSLLMDSLGPQLEKFGKTVEIEGTTEKTQSGILRTNCMDCLDRTNVVQSACGQRALEKQLEEEGVKLDLRTDATTQWFNTLWADNGDQISRQYSSTAALKGDYTRTRQRNYRGAINDLGLTLSRYYNNIVNGVAPVSLDSRKLLNEVDYFSQAAIDYLLGNVTAQVFEEFEATLENRDPSMSMAKVRANAIETSSKIAIADQSEDLIGGWTLLSPREPNTVRTFPFDECVLLVTDAALYRVKFDWNVEKVTSFDRVDLRSITGILNGTYITSTLTTTQTDPERNVGFVIKYTPGKENIARINTRSLSSAVGLDGNDPGDKEGASGLSGKKEDPSMLSVIAFKALPARDSFASMEGQETQAMGEKETIDNVCDEIRRAALGEQGVGTSFLEDQDIISLSEAKKSTGYIEQWGHSLKKLVWA